MRVDVFTIFPEYFDSPLGVSLLGRARDEGLLDVRIHDPRDRTRDRHRSVDDTPFGGGAGMVMTPGPLFESFETSGASRPLFLLSAAGRRFDHRVARELAETAGFSLLCGRYEGVDQRVADYLCDGELSVGDYVLAGGEPAALVMIDAVVRLLPGVMGNEESGLDESFGDGLLEYPQYTRPADFRGHPVPQVLRSGDHARIARWRRAQALHRTLRRRPDLLSHGDLTAADEAVLAEFPDDDDVDSGHDDPGG
jgi:tRNA (guanine37-N1)-methyltransferase